MCSSDEKQVLMSCSHTRQGFPCQGVSLRTTAHAHTNIGTHVKETSSHSLSFSYLGAGLAKDGRKEGGGEVSLFPLGLLPSYPLCFSLPAPGLTLGNARPGTNHRVFSPKGHAQVTLLAKSSSSDQQGQPKSNQPKAS